jgi:MFS family permease
MTSFYGVSAATVPVFIIIYAIGNFLGPLTLGRLFDTIGRKPMIAATYLGSAAVSVVLAVLFRSGSLTSGSFIAIVAVVFFLASAGASAAYLTASEIFPMETGRWRSRSSSRSAPRSAGSLGRCCSAS